MTPAPLDGKTILVTGATFGIGEALTRHLMRYNVHLILVARTAEKLELLKNESLTSAAEVTTFPCDFYREESIDELCTKLKSIPVDYFVSNAGKSIMRSFEDSRFHDYKRTMAVNYLGPVQLISGLTENFRQSKTHIVDISTYNVLMKTPPKWSAYVSSKKAMHSWFESAAPELASLNITVSHIYLTLVESRMKDANGKYDNTSAMPMDRAVAIIMKGLIYHRDYKPWWHVPFQVAMFFLNPFWNIYWRRMIRTKKY